MSKLLVMVLSGMPKLNRQFVFDISELKHITLRQGFYKGDQKIEQFLLKFFLELNTLLLHLHAQFWSVLSWSSVLCCNICQYWTKHWTTVTDCGNLVPKNEVDYKPVQSKVHACQIILLKL